tara:strand:- start:57967 stop:58305 length:339 start_codon:yes stop_codon:yes gene_type:complete
LIDAPVRSKNIQNTAGSHINEPDCIDRSRGNPRVNGQYQLRTVFRVSGLWSGIIDYKSGCRADLFQYRIQQHFPDCSPWHNAIFLSTTCPTGSDFLIDIFKNRSFLKMSAYR